LAPGQIYEVASLNGTGKAAFAQQLCYNALQMGKKVLWISCVRDLQTDKLVHALDEELLENLKTIRITTLAKVYLYLQCVMNKEQFGLVIIEDLSIILSKNSGDLGETYSNTVTNVKKRENLVEIKRHKALQDILKVLNNYSIQNKSAVCLLSPVDVVNMSFVETPNITTSSIPSSGSSSFSSQQYLTPKPKVFYQQVLSSSLGEHPSWSSYIRARLTLYKDWIIGNSKTVSFVHVKHNPTIKKFSHFDNTKKLSTVPISFSIEDSFGIKEVDLESIASEDMKSIEAIDSQPFVVREDDFESDQELGPEERDEDDNDITEEETLLPSSPHRDIIIAKDMLNEASSVSTKVGATEVSDEASADAFSSEIKDREDEQDSEDPTEISIEINHETFMESEPQLDELNDEMEELYPTQPEALTMDELAQLSQTLLGKDPFSAKKRPMDQDSEKRTRPRLVAIQYLNDTDEDLSYIPSSAPLF
jgi:hypothetical protein